MTNASIGAAATTFDLPPNDAMDDRSFAGHPKGLGLLFFVEMWERFSYYGMRALLVLYLVNALRWNSADASLLYGAYTGAVYLTPLLGGWLADRFLGTRRSLVIGGIIISLGHFLLAFGPNTVPEGGVPPGPGAMAAFYLGLVAIVVGTGFFKPNVSTMVGQLYRAGDNRRDAGFTIFYMGINLGAFIAPLACGWLGEKIGWHYGFGAAGVGMLLGLAMYLVYRDRYLPGVGLSPVERAALPEREDAQVADAAGALGAPVTTTGSVAPAVGGAVVGAVLALVAAGGNLSLSNALGVLMAAAAGAAIATAYFGTRGDERRRMIALIIVVVFATFFWLAFEQAGSSMTLFADKNTDRSMGDGTFPASWFQSVQPLSIILLAPVMAWLWNALARRGKEPSTSLKMVLGLALVGAGFLFLVIAGGSADRGMLVSPFWLIAAYVLHSFGELCLSPVGLSYFTKVAPARFTSLMMGVWFLSLAAANYLGGFLASKMDEVSSLTRFFTIPVVTSFGAAIAMLMLVPVLKRLTSSIKDA